MEELFEDAEQYEKMLNQGLSVSGESKFFFIKERMKLLSHSLPKEFMPKTILDFGCGTGETTIELSKLFPDAKVIGSDIAIGALDYCNKKHASEQISFIQNDALDNMPSYFDLCYTNGVFHHIPKNQRDNSLNKILFSLNSGGFFSFFENNPLNPGTRYIMSRIPFDKDAETLTHTQALKLLNKNKFKNDRVTFHFYFPGFLSFLRKFETKLERIPFGAQYHILASKDMGSID